MNLARAARDAAPAHDLKAPAQGRAEVMGVVPWQGYATLTGSSASHLQSANLK